MEFENMKNPYDAPAFHVLHPYLPLCEVFARKMSKEKKSGLTFRLWLSELPTTRIFPGVHLRAPACQIDPFGQVWQDTRTKHNLTCFIRGIDLKMGNLENSIIRKVPNPINHSLINIFHAFLHKNKLAP